MFKLGWFTMCESAIVDTPSNNISLVNCIESIQSSEFPITLPSVVFAIYVYRDAQEDFSPARLHYRIKLVRPDGEVRIAVEQEIESRNPRHRIRAAARGLAIDSPGTRWFVLELESPDRTWNEVARLPLTVQFRRPELAESQTSA